MTQVARAAGVSLTTVSHVLNQTRHVAPATRTKVLEAAEALGYRDLRLVEATEERSGHRVIGVVVPSAASPFFAEMLSGLDAEATRAGMTVLVGVSGEDPVKEASSVRTLLAHDVDALVLVPSTGWRQSTRALLKATSTPVVLVDRLDDDSFDQVGCEGSLATETVVSHLIERGHSRIGMLAGIPGLSTSREREAGFRAAHARAGLAVHEELIVDGSSTVEGGRRATRQLLRRRNPPTAVLCGNNNMTLGFIEALKGEGVRAPDDVAFVSFDDLEWSDLLEPGVTAVSQPFHAIGSRAVKLARSRIDEPGRPPSTVRLECFIEHRTSCGCKG